MTGIGRRPKFHLHGGSWSWDVGGVEWIVMAADCRLYTERRSIVGLNHLDVVALASFEAAQTWIAVARL